MPAPQDLSREYVSIRDAQGQLYTHSIEPELLGLPPRKVRRKPITLAARWALWTLLAGILCLIGYFGQRNLNTLDALLKNGKIAQASVTGKFLSKDTDNGSTHPMLTFTFRTVDGFVESGSMSVDRAAYEKAKTGDPATKVTYLPSSHGQIWQTGVVTDQTRVVRKRVFRLLALNIGVTWCLFIGICEWIWKRQLWLLQNGVAVIGQVVQGKVTRAPKGQIYYDLIYQFPSSGGTINRTARVRKNIYLKHTQGNPFLTVLHNPNNPQKAQLYILLRAVTL